MEIFQHEIKYWVKLFSKRIIQLCIKPRIHEQGTECEERGDWRECYILGNVAKHFGECPQTFRGMSPNIPGNVAKHSGNALKYSGEFHQTFRGMSQNIRENVAKLLSLISECFTVHYVLISSNQS